MVNQWVTENNKYMIYINELWNNMRKKLNQYEYI